MKMTQSKTLLDLSSEIRQLREERDEALNTLKQVREWYVKEGFNKLAPETPIVFSKVWSVLLKNGMGKELT